MMSRSTSMIFALILTALIAWWTNESYNRGFEKGHQVTAADRRPPVEDLYPLVCSAIESSVFSRRINDRWSCFVYCDRGEMKVFWHDAITHPQPLGY